jgi:hypothetical protein
MKWSTKYEKRLPSSPSHGDSSDQWSMWFEEEASKASAVFTSNAITENENENESQIAVPDNGNLTTDSTSAINSPPNQFDPFGLFTDTADMPVCNTFSLSPYNHDTPPPPLLLAPDEQSSILLHHYFSLVCRISSCFDSMYNPFRSEVSGMMVQSPLIFYCVLSMSAAHLYQHEADGASVSLGFQTEAISSLSSDLATLDLESPSPRAPEVTGEKGSLQNALVKDELLFGTILLGMTSVSIQSLSLSLIACHLYSVRPGMIRHL